MCFFVVGNNEFGLGLARPKFKAPCLHIFESESNLGDKSVDAYVLEGSSYILHDVYTLYSESELSTMTEQERAAIVTKFKCSLFNDLEISLEDIFYRTFWPHMIAAGLKASCCLLSRIPKHSWQMLLAGQQNQASYFVRINLCSYNEQGLIV